MHEKIYDNLIVCFQRGKMNDDAMTEREESDITEDAMAQDFCSQFRKINLHCKNRAHDLKCIQVFVDSHDRELKCKAKYLLLFNLKRAIPKDMFQIGDLEQIVSRVIEYDTFTQSCVQAVEIHQSNPTGWTYWSGLPHSTVPRHLHRPYRLHSGKAGSNSRRRPGHRSCHNE